MDEISENIIGLDFIQKQRLHYNDKTRKIKFLTTLSKALCAIKKVVIPTLSKAVIMQDLLKTTTAL
jgi:hypothetical protein